MIANNNSEGVHEMIEYGATLEPVDTHGRSALHYIVQMTDSEDAFNYIMSLERLKGTYDINE